MYDKKKFNQVDINLKENTILTPKKFLQTRFKKYI